MENVEEEVNEEINHLINYGVPGISCDIVAIVLKNLLIDDILNIVREYATECIMCENNKTRFIRKMSRIQNLQVEKNEEWGESTSVIIAYDEDTNKVSLDYVSESGTCDMCESRTAFDNTMTVEEFVCCITHLYGFYKCLSDYTTDMITDMNKHNNLYSSAYVDGYLDDQIVKEFNFEIDKYNL